MPINLDTTNTWLAVMAIAIAVQTLLMLGVAFAAWRALQQTTEALQRLEERHLSPMSARVTAVADDVREVITRVRRADDAVREQLSRFEGVAHVAGQAIGQKVWPVVGLSRAVMAAARSLASRTTDATSSTAAVTPVSSSPASATLGVARAIPR